MVYNRFILKKERLMKARNIILTVLLGLAIIISTITFSIGLPIYLRPFYYAHIDALDMPSETGWSKQTIKEAYDEVLDYLTLPGGEFGSGELSFSEEGASHFADCKALFNLNLWAFIISATFIITVCILKKRGLIEFSCGSGYALCLCAGATTLLLFALVGGVAAIDFDTAFYVFHAIFFPGKDNWLFDPRADEIINVMPQEFFMNCAILIVSSIITISLTLIIIGAVARIRAKKTNQTT